MCGQLMNILLIFPVASDLRRVKRQSEESASKGPAASAEGEAESEAEAPPKSEGVSLGKILGLVFLACCILYCIGISWKVYKVCKGTYVEEEPVFLKYKWTSQKICMKNDIFLEKLLLLLLRPKPKHYDEQKQKIIF